MDILGRLFIFTSGGNFLLLLFAFIAFASQIRKFPLFKSIIIVVAMWLILISWKIVLLILGYSKFEIVTPQRISLEFIVALLAAWAVADITMVCRYKWKSIIWLLIVPCVVSIINAITQVTALQPYYKGYVLIVVVALCIVQILRAQKFSRLLKQYFSTVDTLNARWIYIASAVFMVFLTLWLFLRFIQIRGLGVVFNVVSSITLISTFILLMRNQKQIYLIYMQYKDNAFNEFAQEVEDSECISISNITKQQPSGKTPGNADSYVGFKERIDTLFKEQKLYLQPELTINDLAAHLNTNRTYVSYYLNNVIEETFVTYVNAYRLNDAKELLITEPNMSADEIAIRCGFRSLTTFRRAFMKKFGESPVSYRNNNATQS